VIEMKRFADVSDGGLGEWRHGAVPGKGLRWERRKWWEEGLVEGRSIGDKDIKKGGQGGCERKKKL